MQKCDAYLAEYLIWVKLAKHLVFQPFGHLVYSLLTSCICLTFTVQFSFLTEYSRCWWVQNVYLMLNILCQVHLLSIVRKGSASTLLLGTGFCTFDNVYFCVWSIRLYKYIFYCSKVKHIKGKRNCFWYMYVFIWNIYIPTCFLSIVCCHRSYLGHIQ